MIYSILMVIIFSAIIFFQLAEGRRISIETIATMFLVVGVGSLIMGNVGVSLNNTTYFLGLTGTNNVSSDVNINLPEAFCVSHNMTYRFDDNNLFEDKHYCMSGENEEGWNEIYLINGIWNFKRGGK